MSQVNPAVLSAPQQKISAREDGLLRKLWHNPKSRYSMLILLLVIAVGIAGPWFAPHDPTKPYYEALLAEPSAEHLLGTDSIGRDVFSRLLHGTRVTLMVAVMAVSITFITGTFIGVTSAFVGGVVDSVLMRIMDILLAIPNIIMAMAIVAILGPSLTNAMIAVGIAGIPKYARLTRGSTLGVKSSGYVEASRAMGTSQARILLFQIMPNIMSTLLVYTTLQIGIAILDTAALSFIGLGAQPPTPEWGTMLSEGKEYITDAWWLATFPGLSISIVVFSVNILGDALRDILDPKSN